MEDLDERDLDEFLKKLAQYEQQVSARTLQRREMVRQGHETIELQIQTNWSGQSFEPLLHLATLVDDLPCKQSWGHHFGALQQLPHESESLQFQTSTPERQEHQTLIQFPGQQKRHCARRERHEPQWRHSVPKQEQEECSGYPVQPLHDVFPGAPIRRPMLRKMWLQCRQKNSCHLSCHLCV